MHVEKVNSTTLDPVVEDMSITLLAGRVQSAAVALDQAEEAERLGFKRVWIPERYSNKECGSLLGGMAARTSRLGVGSGPLSALSRYPVVMAAMLATLQSMYGGQRISFGMGRGGGEKWFPHFGFKFATYEEIVDYAIIIKTLLRGERVEHLGPAGDFRGLELADKTPGPIPEIIFFHMGGPIASKVAANPVFDASASCNIQSAEAHGTSIQATLKECERIGRDPKTIKFISPVTSAPAMSEDDTRDLIACRIVQYLSFPMLGERLRIMNGWSESEVNKLMSHPLVSNVMQKNDKLVDHTFTRPQLMEVAKHVPESWMRHTGIMGSIDECVKALQLYKDAGADEIDFYGSTPAQNADLIRAWRKHTEANKSQGTNA
ncbi:TIGR03857 family LLM class F420-dependent oxidoreductase [Zhongshania marina]|uniref:TIGR03857 family LLM class F420-dependent oxidoreductase n=1 Tax=Zhongshania marina TaxID=2304603 RepID=A0ABX9W6I3_9GAMM|nr:TIGR03857 family LLM class F420-dependent oxidoreductase [Zhongshania marina]